jgi:uncharacterized protein
MLKQILSEFLSIDGVTMAAVIGRDGFVIEIVQIDPVDTDALGVVCSGQMKFFERGGRVLKKGRPRQVVQEYQNGTLLLTQVTREEFLVILTKIPGGLGHLTYTLPKICSRIAAVI